MSSPCSSSTAPAPEAHADCLTIPAARRRSRLREYAEACALAVVLAFGIRSCVVQAFRIPSGSMLPTLQIGDYILVNKFMYGLHVPGLPGGRFALERPRRGDVVVFAHPTDPSKDFIKRVVGVEGDRVQIRAKRVYVNDALWDDPHGFFAGGDGTVEGGMPRDNYGPVTVPPDHVFVLGDNRDRSYDSRFWGFVPAADVKGRAFLVFWSWNGTDHGVRWDRLGSVIQ